MTNLSNVQWIMRFFGPTIQGQRLSESYPDVPGYLDSIVTFIKTRHKLKSAQCQSLCHSSHFKYCISNCTSLSTSYRGKENYSHSKLC